MTENWHEITSLIFQDNGLDKLRTELDVHGIPYHFNINEKVCYLNGPSGCVTEIYLRPNDNQWKITLSQTLLLLIKGYIDGRKFGYYEGHCEGRLDEMILNGAFKNVDK
jgi:hypothetical protein